MKKIAALGVVVFALATLSSCKKTTTCYYQDPETGEEVTTDVTTARNLHKEAVNQHTKNGWTCE